MQIKQRVEALQEDVDVLLHSELESADKRFKDARFEYIALSSLLPFIWIK